MPKVTIQHDSDMKVNDAYQKIKTFFDNDKDIKKLDPKVTSEFNDKTMTGTAKGSQFKAAIQVKEKGKGTTVSIEVDLPLLLTPFKGKVQEMIQKKLAHHLA